jgi:superfamily II DNA/RNA helicase
LIESFDALGLSAPTSAGLRDLGFDAPTEVQAAAIPPLLEGRDGLIQAPTGSGKTAAFVIPLAERCMRVNDRTKTVALVLCPTRELATQGEAVAAELLAPHGMRTTCLIGGVGYAEQRLQLKQIPQVIFGSPGRVMDHIWEGRLDTAHLDIVVIDEADQLLDQGFAPEVMKILSYLPRQRQTILVSATLPDWVKTVLQHELTDPVRITVEGNPTTDGVIDHQILETSLANRFEDLCGLLSQKRTGSAIVFGRTKRGVEKLDQQLRRAGYRTEAIQGNMSQVQRERALDNFRDGRADILVATNVAARGIDVRHVSLVINYELPESADLLTHRVGRTGRMGDAGVAYTLMTREDEVKWRRLRRDGAPDLPRLQSTEKPAKRTGYKPQARYAT